MKENELIAEFMGFTSEKNIGWYDNNMMMPQSVYDSQDGNCFDDLLFDKSWDWLMPVVEKIYQLGWDNESILLVRDAVAEANLDSTYKAVVEFIMDSYCSNCGEWQDD
jgi:hypothetical protein